MSGTTGGHSRSAHGCCATGDVIIADPVMLREHRRTPALAGYMANSSIDGVIWRFTAEAFKH